MGLIIRLELLTKSSARPAMISAWLRPNGFFMSPPSSSENAILCTDDPLYRKQDNRNIHMGRKVNCTAVDSRRCAGCERSCIPATTIYDESALVSTLNTSKRSELWSKTLTMALIDSTICCGSNFCTTSLKSIEYAKKTVINLCDYGEEEEENIKRREEDVIAYFTYGIR